MALIPKIANIKGTPLFIETLINIHVRPDANLNSPGAKQVIEYCKKEKLIGLIGLTDQPTKGSMYRLTERGKAFLKMLEDTPLPSVKQVYADPRTGEQVGSFVVPGEISDDEDEDDE
jgi:hypothetical protein